MKNNSSNLPVKQLISIAITLICEPIAFTSLFPFVYFMVKDLKVVKEGNEKDIGYYVGIISSCFALAGCFTSLFWGYLSDKIGRRPVILVGLLGSCFFMLLFGISPTYTFAVITRTLCGALNGNNAIRQSMLAEISNDENRHKIFSISPAIYLTGSMVGPFIGGYLYRPTLTFPSYFGNNQFLEKYPYFLPCAICSLLYFLSFVYAYFYLEETLKRKSSEELPLIADNNIHIEKSLFEKIRELKYSVWSCILSSCGLFFMFTINDELLPLWCATLLEKGGLSFDSTKIGNLMLTSGFVTLFSQITLCSKLQEILGVLRLYKLTTLFIIVTYIVYPFCNMVQKNTQSEFLGTLVLYFITIVRVTLSVFASTSLSIIVVQSATSDNLGLVNGLNYSFLSIGRALGPLVCGLLWSLSFSVESLYPYNTYLVWFFLAFLAGLNILLSGLIKYKNGKHDQ